VSVRSRAMTKTCNRCSKRSAKKRDVRNSGRVLQEALASTITREKAAARTRLQTRLRQIEQHNLGFIVSPKPLPPPTPDVTVLEDDPIPFTQRDEDDSDEIPFARTDSVSASFYSAAAATCNTTADTSATMPAAATCNTTADEVIPVASIATTTPPKSLPSASATCNTTADAAPVTITTTITRNRRKHKKEATRLYPVR